MEGLANGVEMTPCPHCGQDVRRGMIRCRECGKPVVEIPVEGDFALTGHELLSSQDAKCPLCGAVLESGATDCASCTSALLDQLLHPLRTVGLGINANDPIFGKIRRMATPGQLVKTMAEALGIPAETVTNYDRVLSENGMRSKSGRGRGAAKVTASDAANLLIAILGSPVAGASVKARAKSWYSTRYPLRRSAIVRSASSATMSV